ncbi:type II toxin-antitoxin system Rv0910 family toxin [Nocardia vinacea]|uniref:type II toxin-antitoxin system Rv0910 family toxin n=1 Tax=Nocardia vinacea TaxID=96468 RepID=UPI0002FE1E76|nr:SRPBCC family protein [Nocardia vinacea]
MRTAQSSATFQASPDQVWQVIGDPSRWNEWLVIHKSWKSAVPAELTTGATATAAASVVNMPVTIDWTFENVDAPRSVAMGGTTRAGVKLALAISLRNEAQTTTVDVTASIDGGMIDGPMGGVFKNSLVGALDKSPKKAQGLVAQR